MSNPNAKRLEQALKRPDNRECFDCSTVHPRWASTNLGIFLCMRCAGVHRGLGTHISKVKNVTLDVWEDHMVQHIESMGNVAAREYFPMPGKVEKPAPDTPTHIVERLARLKYENRPPPPPLRSGAGAGASAAASSSPGLPPITPMDGVAESTFAAAINNKPASSSSSSSQPILQGKVVSSSPAASGQQHKATNSGAGLDDIFGAAASPSSSSSLANNNSSTPSKHSLLAGGVVSPGSSPVGGGRGPTMSKATAGSNNNNNSNKSLHLHDDPFGEFVGASSSSSPANVMPPAPAPSMMSSATSGSGMSSISNARVGSTDVFGSFPSSSSVQTNNNNSLDIFGAPRQAPRAAGADLFKNSVGSSSTGNNNNVRATAQPSSQYTLAKDPFASLAAAPGTAAAPFPVASPAQTQQQQQHQPKNSTFESLFG